MSYRTDSPAAGRMTSPKARILRDVMRVLRIADDDMNISDKCIDNLRKTLAAHLYDRMQRWVSVCFVWVLKRDGGGGMGGKGICGVVLCWS